MTNRNDDPHRYDDILHLPHHVSVTHPHMSLYDRAAQFMPFKALSGYEDDVTETARVTDTRIELDVGRIELLDAKLQLLGETLADSPSVSITYFLPDTRKAGGSYQTVFGAVKKIDTVQRIVVMRDGQIIAIDNIFDISGDLFSALDNC